MGIPVSSYEEFKKAFETHRNNCDLFGFILFDERDDHQVIKNFCENNFRWLDSLASTYSMVLFMPIDQRGESNTYRNCSIPIAAQFHITPRDLPAFLLFAVDHGEICVKHSGYLKTTPSAFAGSADDAKALITDIFSAVHEARQDQAPDELMIKLQKKIASIQRSANIRPIKRWTRDYVLSLANLPRDLLQAMAQAYGRRIAG